MRICFVLAFCAIMSGCRYTEVTDGVISTRGIEFGSPDKTYRIDYSRRICGYDRRHIVFVIPLGGPPSLDEAVDAALDKVQGQFAVGLASAQVRSRWFYIPYVYGQSWYSAEGYPIYETQRKIMPVPQAVSEKSAGSMNAPQKQNVKTQKPTKEEGAKDGLDDFPF